MNVPIELIEHIELIRLSTWHEVCVVQAEQGYVRIVA